MPADQVFSLMMSVRDYECDLQGVVNNAVYQHYLEHARHEFLKARNIDFAALASAGINLVVVRAELDYRSSLTSGDVFRVNTRVEPVSRLKFGFRQEIVRQGEQRAALQALVVGTAVNSRGRPFMPEQLKGLVEGL